MKKYIIFSLLILALGTPSLTAQEKENKNTVFRLSLYAPGAGVEFGLVDNFTLSVQGGATVSFESSNEFKINFPLYAFISPRYYYNLNRRKEKGKRVAKFAANYVGVFLGHMFNISDSDPYSFATLVWGMQRNLGKKTYLDFNVGFGFFFKESETTYSAHLGFFIGFAF